MAKPPPRFPDKDEVLRFIRASAVPVGKREIARAFRLSGSTDRERLKTLLREIEADGTVERGRGRRVAPPNALPEVAVLTVASLEADGEPRFVPADWAGDGPPPAIFPVSGLGRDGTVFAAGDAVLARLARVNDRLYEARLLRRLDRAVGRIVGVYRPSAEGGRIVSTEKRARAEFIVLPPNRNEAEPDELVLADILPALRGGLPQARVTERLGPAGSPRAASLIAIHALGIPDRFGSEALAEAARATVPGPVGRRDLRSLPLVTIDGADARDFDDAVWAEPLAAGGWRLVVAIADVAHSVPPGSALDRTAFERGNSVYFPDRVVPMLPEALSNGICSLKPGEDRACLAFELHLDRRGELIGHELARGVMRSAARLTYEQVQEAHEGRPDETTGPLLQGVIEPLYGAFSALWAARSRRGTLDLDLPERLVRLDDRGRVAEIGVRRRLDSHRLIEEFMIAANVAAARRLDETRIPGLHRVHDRPSLAKLEALRGTLAGLGYSLARTADIRPEHFTRLLAAAAGRPESALVSEVILRAQAQASYAPDNIGHFGLALERYAHFTSPIRRYADLIVHRALIRACGLGPDGLRDADIERLEAIGEHVSATERRAATAERDATDRFMASWLADRVGEVFRGRISGVTRFGLFIRLEPSGADGFLPTSALPEDRYEHDETMHMLTGRQTGRVFRLGGPITVRLVEADVVTGTTTFAHAPGVGPDS